MYILSVINLIITFLPIACVFIGSLVFISKQRFKPFIAMVIIFICIGASYTLPLSYTYYSGRNVDLLIHDENLKDLGYLSIILDNDDKLVGFGQVPISVNGKLPIYAYLQFNENHELIGDKNALKYKKAISSSLSDAHCLKYMVGTSKDYNEMQTLDENNKVKVFSVKAFLALNSIWIVLSAILLISYKLTTIRRRKRLEKTGSITKIHDL